MNFEIHSIHTLFYLAGIFIAFFSSLLVAGKNRKTTADYLLSAWFFVIGLHLCFFLLLFSGEYVNYPFLLGLEIPLPFFHGPMLYLYILFLTGWTGSKKSWLLHFAPAVIIYILLLEFFLSHRRKRFTSTVTTVAAIKCFGFI